MPTHKFSLAVIDEAGTVRGVAIVMRPAARMLDDGWTAEVARLATDGCENACSALYGAAWRTARAMGYRRMTTFILDEEPGTSLRAAGWRKEVDTYGGTWNRPSRPHRDRHPLNAKQRWAVGAAKDETRAMSQPAWPQPEDGHRQIGLFDAEGTV